jgi:hypothetical protein
MFYSGYTRSWMYVHRASNTRRIILLFPEGRFRGFRGSSRKKKTRTVSLLLRDFWCQDNRNCFGSRCAGVDKTSLGREVKFPSSASFSKQGIAFSWNAARCGFLARTLPYPFARCDGRIRAVSDASLCLQRIKSTSMWKRTIQLIYRVMIDLITAYVIWESG